MKRSFATIGLLSMWTSCTQTKVYSVNSYCTCAVVQTIHIGYKITTYTIRSIVVSASCISSIGWKDQSTIIGLRLRCYGTVLIIQNLIKNLNFFEKTITPIFKLLLVSEGIHKLSVSGISWLHFDADAEWIPRQCPVFSARQCCPHSMVRRASRRPLTTSPASPRGRLWSTLVTISWSLRKMIQTLSFLTTYRRMRI